jgi:hypothetical protein
MTSTGQVKVLDFGIAKALSLSRKVTRNDFGTMPYLSPERLDTGDVNELSDLWAVGVMLYEMVRGTAPFWAQDTRRLEQLILARSPAPPLGDGCPVGLQAIVAKLLAPTPGERYDNATHVREDLEQFSAGKQTQAEQEGFPRGAADEPTRRTHAPIASADTDEEKTRRTHVAAEKNIPVVAARPRRFARSRRVIRAALILMAIVIIAKEIHVGVMADRLAAHASTHELEQLADAWTSYERLADRSYLGIGTAGLERSLIRRTSALADRVIADFRSPFPTVRERQWQLARDSLARALDVGGDDRRLRAALRYCEGHLHRINGEASIKRREVVAGQRELANAVAAFREAAELRSGWPDPFLGLARTFVYGLDDLDRGADALEEAQRHGYVATDRETAQLADGYRARGNSLVRSARQLSGLPQETDLLTRAAEAYREALTLYSKAIGFADVPRNIRLTQRALDEVHVKLDELSGSDAARPVPDDSPTVTEPPPSGSVRSEVSTPWA